MPNEATALAVAFLGTFNPRSRRPQALVDDMQTAAHTCM